MNSEASLNHAANLAPTALPVSNARLAMWLFLSTEVMLFAALLSAYYVFRGSVAPDSWPTVEDTRMHWWIGLGNSVVLLASSVSLAAAIRASRRGSSSAGGWVGVTLFLAAAFLCIKGYEYYDKWRVGIFNFGESSLIHEQADLHYLAHIKSVLRGRLQGGTASQPGGISTGPAGEGGGDTPKPRSELLMGGLVDWTGALVGQESDAALRGQALKNTAWLIYPHRTLSDATRLENERMMLRQQRQSDADRLNADRARLQSLTAASAGSGGAGQNSSALSEDERARIDEIDAEAASLTQQVASQVLALGRLDDRLRLLDASEADWGLGIIRAGGDRLPMVIPHGQSWASLYLLLTGCHVLHVAGGMLALSIFWPRGPWPRATDRLINISLYWYFVELVWIGLFLLFYIIV